MSGRGANPVPLTSSLSGPVEATEEREVPMRMRRRTVSESAAITMMRRRHSDFDDTWSRNFEPKEEEEEEGEEEVEESGAIGDEELEGIFQFSAESSRSNSESAAVAGPPSDSEDDDCDSVYGDARSRQTSFVRAE